MKRPKPFPGTVQNSKHLKKDSGFQHHPHASEDRDAAARCDALWLPSDICWLAYSQLCPMELQIVGSEGTASSAHESPHKKQHASQLFFSQVVPAQMRRIAVSS